MYMETSETPMSTIKKMVVAFALIGIVVFSMVTAILESWISRCIHASIPCMAKNVMLVRVACYLLIMPFYYFMLIETVIHAKKYNRW